MFFDDSKIIINVNIPDGVTEIVDRTGSENPYINKVIIPGSVESIRNDVFRGCINLKHVVFKHSNVKNQRNGSGIFADCPNLQKVCFADFETFDSYSYDCGGPLDNGSMLYISGKVVRDFIIPNNLTSGNHNCIRNLHGAKGIKSIRFADGNDIIGYSYEIVNENFRGTKYGITKSGFDEIAFSKHPEAKETMKIYRFKSVDEIITGFSLFCLSVYSIITSYNDFENECITSIHSVSPRPRFKRY